MWKTILTAEERAVFALRGLYREQGYAPYKMSRFEEYDLYVRCRDFLPSDQVITFSGPNGKLLAMKPDVTLSIVKNAPQEPGVVQKVYYNENVYRMDRGAGSFREIMQTGLECVGDLSQSDIAQVVLLAAKSMALLGGRYLLNISHVGLLWSVLDGSGLSGEGKREALACIRQKKAHDLTALCRREGIGGEELLLLLRARSLGDLEALEDSPALQELRLIAAILEREGFGECVRVDFSVGNDMKYYDGVVFKGYLEGIPASVLSGGQYDRLARKMGRKSRAIGFAVYVDWLERMGQGGDGN